MVCTMRASVGHLHVSAIDEELVAKHTGTLGWGVWACYCSYKCCLLLSDRTMVRRGHGLRDLFVLAICSTHT